MTTGHKEQKPSIWVHGTVAEGYNTTIVSEEMEKPYAAPRRVDDLSGHGSTIPISLATVHCYVHRAHGLYGGTFGLFDRRL